MRSTKHVLRLIVCLKLETDPRFMIFFEQKPFYFLCEFYSLLILKFLKINLKARSSICIFLHGNIIASYPKTIGHGGYGMTSRSKKDKFRYDFFYVVKTKYFAPYCICLKRRFYETGLFFCSQFLIFVLFLHLSNSSLSSHVGVKVRCC